MKVCHRHVTLLPFIVLFCHLCLGQDTLQTKMSSGPGEQASLPFKPFFQWLPLGDIKPGGWIKAQMLRDLDSGFAGHLGTLAKETSSDIFTTNRNRPDALNTANQDGVAWWNGESEGNWRTGFIMMAYLAGNKKAMKEADDYVDKILAFQDNDGYIGINAPALRFKPGDLWTKTCLLRGLLAYASLAKREDVYEAVKRAVDEVLNVIGPGKQKLVWSETHDLMFSDILEKLFERTAEIKYRDFALWLYEDFSKNANRPETGIDSLLKRYAPFTWHGVHVYEHLRVPLWLWFSSGESRFGYAWQNAAYKLGRYSFPGGAAVGMELVQDRLPDPSVTESEYCDIKEIQCDMESALQKTGEAAYAERVERTWFNDAQAWRMPDGTGITYLAAENQLTVNGQAVDGNYVQPRNKYSPTHADAAVCCNPNATQVAPLYVSGMWMRQQPGVLAAVLYGPCSVTTRIKNTPVNIAEETNYPFENDVTLNVNPASEVEFTIMLRDPAWSRATKVITPGASVTRQGEYWLVKKKWKKGDKVKLLFSAEVKEVTAVNGEAALQYGALLFALPLPSKKVIIKNYTPAWFEDCYYIPIEPHQPVPGLPASLRWKGFGFNIARGVNKNYQKPFDAPVIYLQGNLIRQDNHELVPVSLVPLGNAYLLRRLTFPVVL